MMENLDFRCAKLGNELADIQGADDKFLTSALAVLEEQGVYAFFLFLKAYKKNTLAQEVRKKCHDFLKATPKAAPLLGEANGADVLKVLETEAVSGDLNKLLMIRDLLRQSLVYGRYHAKAKTEKPVGAGG